MTRRDARVVEWGGLENRYPRKWIQGSNPCLSAKRMTVKEFSIKLISEAIVSTVTSDHLK